MTIQELKEKIVKIITEQSSKDVKEITSEAKITELGLDTLDLVEISLSLEEIFGIEVDDEEAEKLTTVDDLIAYTFGLVEKKEDKSTPEEPKPEPEDNKEKKAEDDLLAKKEEDCTDEEKTKRTAILKKREDDKKE